MIPVSDTVRRRSGYIVVVLAMTGVATNVVLSRSIGEAGHIPEQVLLGLAFGTVAVIALRAAPRNGAVWALVWGALFGAWGAALEVMVPWRTGFTFDQIAGGALPGGPASLDLLSAMIVNLGGWLWLGYFFLPIHLVLLFPTGRASSRTWRWLMWLAAADMAVSALVGFMRLGPWVQTPYEELFTDGMLPVVGWSNLILLLLVPAAVGNLIVRFRRSSGVERLQFRWLTWSTALLAASLLVGIVLAPIGLANALPDLQGWISTLALAGVPVSIGIAITKYRLYDIDVVISRTLVFVALVGFLTMTYAGLVVGLGNMVGGSDVGWSIGATALVAVVFEPVRSRVQRWVNRLVYGRKATPYEVLSDLTGRLEAAESDEGLLDRMALRLAEGTGGDRAVVWTRSESGFRAAAWEPTDGRPTGSYDRLAALPGTVVPIEHDGDVLGALSIETRRSDVLSPTELRLVRDLAGSAGLLLQRLRLDAELERKAHELAASRSRLLDAQDLERRRLERDLNEGAQQHVVALKLNLARAAQIAEREGSEKTSMMVEQMAAEAQHAIDQIKALAYGIYPPLLEAEGLPAAVTALADLTPIDVRVDANLPGRYPLPTEAAIYFAISEALTNATKHGEGPIQVRMYDTDDGLTFQVTDSGPGFDPHDVPRGAGLTNMTDRLDALAGTLTITTRPGHPTTVTGHLPVTTAVGA